jgi:hypothetical protein
MSHHTAQLVIARPLQKRRSHEESAVTGGSGVDFILTYETDAKLIRFAGMIHRLNQGHDHAA